MTALGMRPAAAAVHIPFVHQLLDEEENLLPNEVMEQAVTGMLDELTALESALRPLRLRATEVVS